MTIAGDRRELGGEGRTRRDAFLPHAPLLPPSFSRLTSLSHSSLNLSPQSSVQTAISGHPVAMATLATLGHRAAGARSGMSLFFCSPSSSVCLFSCSLCLALTSLPKMQKRQLHFVSPHLPPRVVLCTHPSISRSFVSFMCHAVCLSLSVKRQSCRRVVESWQSRLSCGVPSCQTYQSCAPAYLPVSDGDKSARLV